LHQEESKLRKWSSEDAKKNSELYQELKKIIRDCIVYEESKIKNGYLL
jgi:hypothetical protein